MEIKDLKPKMGNVNIVLEITEKGNAREFDKFGKKGQVCNAKAKDDSGEIVLTLWNDDVSNFNVGDKVSLTNGYVSEYQGEMQLGTGKFGKLELIEGEERTKLGVANRKDIDSEEELLKEVKAKRSQEEDDELHEIGEELEELSEEGKEYGEDDKVFLEDEFVEEEVVDEKKHHKK